MPQSHPARGLRRIELTTAAPEPTADFYAHLLGWTVLPEPDEVFGGWVGDRLAVRISPGETTAWNLVFGGTPARPLDHGASVDRGRVLHGPWAPEPRPGEPCWVELHGVPDTDAHYADELGWRARDPDEPFTLYDVELDGAARPVAGRLTTDTGLAPGWMVYFSVPDVDRPPRPRPTSAAASSCRPARCRPGWSPRSPTPPVPRCTLLQAPAGWGGAWAHVPEPTDSGTVL